MQRVGGALGMRHQAEDRDGLYDYCRGRGVECKIHYPVPIYRQDGLAFLGYRADPDGIARGRLVVIQEIFGVNRHIRGVCDRFAASGYTALAPALFDRREGPGSVGLKSAPSHTPGADAGRCAPI